MNFVLPPNRAAERNQVANRRALDSRAEEDHHILLRFERCFQLHKILRSLRVELAFFRGKPPDRLGFAILAGACTALFAWR